MFSVESFRGEDFWTRATSSVCTSYRRNTRVQREYACTFIPFCSKCKRNAFILCSFEVLLNPRLLVQGVLLGVFFSLLFVKWLMMKKEKKLCGRVENNLKSVHLVLLKCAPSFPHTKKKRAHHQNGTKKTKQKKIVPTSNILTKKKTTLYPRPRDIFLCVGLSLCLHPPWDASSASRKPMRTSTRPTRCWWLLLPIGGEEEEDRLRRRRRRVLCLLLVKITWVGKRRDAAAIIITKRKL